MTVRDDTDHEVRARRGPAHGRGWLRTASLLGVVVLVGAWLWLVYGSTVFAVTGVEVTGVHRLTTAEVGKAAAVPMGRPLARVDVDAVAVRVGRLPQVASVTVDRSWPHSVHIAVTERVAVAVVHRGGQWWLVDRTAVVVATQHPRPKLPVLHVARPEPGDPSARAALAVVDRLPASFAAHVSSIAANSPDSVRLRVRVREAMHGDAHHKAHARTVTVVWGNADRTEQKIRVFTALHKANPHGRVYDVSTPDVATVRR